MHTLSATELLLYHVFVAGVHEPLWQEANAVALLQPSDSPNAGQPHRYNFPKWLFGNKTTVYRSFQAVWFDWSMYRCRWLHYNCSRYVAFCFIYIKIRQGKVNRRRETLLVHFQWFSQLERSHQIQLLIIIVMTILYLQNHTYTYQCYHRF